MATTGQLYAGAAAAATGTWGTTANATGSGTGTYATWTSSTSGASAILELSSFAASIPAGATIDSVVIVARVKVSDTARINSASGQLLSGTTAKGAAQTVTRATTDTETTWTVTGGITLAEVADLRVRLTFGKLTQAISTTASVDRVSVEVNYTPAVAGQEPGRLLLAA